VLQYGYDADGDLTSASDPSANYSFTYDDLNRLTQTSVSDLPGLSSVNVTLNQTWDYNSNRTSLTASINNVTEFTNTYSYNNLDQMVSVQQSGNAVATKEVDFGYDADGRLSTIDRYAGTHLGPLVAHSAYSYDADSNLTGLVDTDSSNTTLAAYTWNYDAAGRVTQSTSTGDGTLATPGTATYTYDNDNQLLTASYSNYTTPPAAYSQTYDANGNRTGGSQTSSDNHVTFDGTYHYQYDGEGNRIARWEQIAGNAGLTAPAAGDTDITLYTWDNRDRLTSVTHYQHYADIGLSQPDSQVEYAYDVFNRLVSEHQTVGGTLDEDYVYDGANLLMVLNGATGALEESELWGPGVDQILASDAAGVASWMLTDNEGTVRDVAQYASGQTTVVDHLVYSAFGVLSSQTGAAYQPRFTYTAQRYDPATGLLYYNARWYDAKTGGFVSQDPSGFNAGDANLNRYCFNDPTDVTDPSGCDGQPSLLQQVQQQNLWANDVLSETSDSAKGMHPYGGDVGDAVAAMNPDNLAKGVGQGALNTVNGLQDWAIGNANAAIQAQAGPVVGLLIPSIPSPNWAKDMVVPNDPLQGVSQFVGGQAAGILLTVGIAEAAEGIGIIRFGASGGGVPVKGPTGEAPPTGGPPPTGPVPIPEVPSTSSAPPVEIPPPDLSGPWPGPEEYPGPTPDEAAAADSNFEPGGDYGPSPPRPGIGPGPGRGGLGPIEPNEPPGFGPGPNRGGLGPLGPSGPEPPWYVPPGTRSG
jgi:RHS repeat-associated protein